MNNQVKFVDYYEGATLIDSGKNCTIAARLLNLALQQNASNPNEMPSFEHRRLCEISYLLREGACHSALITFDRDEVSLTVKHFEDELPVVVEIRNGFIWMRDFGSDKKLYTLDLKKGAFESVLIMAEQVAQKLNELAEILN